MTNYTLEITPKLIQKYNIYYNSKLDSYVFKFPIYKYYDIPVLFCKAIVDKESKNLRYLVINNTDSVYAGFYNREYGENGVITSLIFAIKHEFHLMGVKGLENDFNDSMQDL